MDLNLEEIRRLDTQLVNFMSQKCRQCNIRYTYPFTSRHLCIVEDAFPADWTYSRNLGSKSLPEALEADQRRTGHALEVFEYSKERPDLPIDYFVEFRRHRSTASSDGGAPPWWLPLGPFSR